MSWTREVTIWCDVCGNWEQVSGTVQQARRELKKRGWKRWWKRPDKDGDVCPNCTAKQDDS